MLPSLVLSCPNLLCTSLWNKWYKIALLLNFWKIENAPAVALYVVAVCSLSVELIFDPVWHTCSTTLSHTPYVSLMIIQNKAPCGASLWRCSGFSCQGCKRNYRRRNTHTHTLSNTLIGSLFHTACQFGLCNPQYPERLRSSGCWQRTLDDTLSLSGGAPDCAENMWGLDTEIESKKKAARRPWSLSVGKICNNQHQLFLHFSSRSCSVVVIFAWSSHFHYPRIRLRREKLGK